MTPQPRRRALSLEELDLWLASDQAPAKGGWNVSAVDGLIADPEPIRSAEWTRLIPDMGSLDRWSASPLAASRGFEQ
jgi:hypothetical protein